MVYILSDYLWLLFLFKSICPQKKSKKILRPLALRSAPQFREGSKDPQQYPRAWTPGKNFKKGKRRRAKRMFGRTRTPAKGSGRWPLLMITDQGKNG